MILLKFLPSLIQIVFRRLHWIPERPVAAGVKPITKVFGIPYVGGISEASKTPKRPLVPAPI